MPPIFILAAAMIVASTSTADAKRFRSLPGTSKTPAVAPSVAAKPASAKPAAAAPTKSRSTVVIFGTSSGSATAAEQQRRTQGPIGNTAWSSAAEAPVAPLAAKPPINPDARQLPTLGFGGGDTRPAKGFASVN